MSTLPQRSQSIDVMRGLTLTLMIVVNMSISEEKSYAPLLHAVWHGLTLTDLVFPSFLFVVGTALAFTLEKYQSMGDAAVLRKIFMRTALIFLCGYLLYWFPFFEFDKAGHLALLPLEKTRILGVLQRIALSYAVAAALVQLLKPRSLAALALALLPWIVSGAQGLRQPAVGSLLAALILFLLTRWPSGNLWDAVLDPWLWLVALVHLLRAPWRRR